MTKDAASSPTSSTLVLAHLSGCVLCLCAGGRRLSWRFELFSWSPLLLRANTAVRGHISRDVQALDGRAGTWMLQQGRKRSEARPNPSNFELLLSLHSPALSLLENRHLF